MRKVFLFFSSLKLTVFLLLCSIAVLLFGTLDQANWDIWDIKKFYFEAWFTAWPKGNFEAWFGKAHEGWGRGPFLPMPGGFALAALWLANLGCAHFRHFRPRWVLAGIPLIHGGVIILIIGGFITAFFQEDYDMPIPTGQTRDTIIESRTRREQSLPFSLHLEKFTHEYYPGTQIAKNFASAVRLKDSAESEGRSVTIAMNKPLRHEGYTFYQAQFRLEGMGGHSATTILHVVRNPAWQLPYIAMFVMSLGLLVQFLIMLGRFLKRMERRTQKTTLVLAFFCLSSGVAGAQPMRDGLVPAGAPKGHVHHAGDGHVHAPPPMLPGSPLQTQPTATEESTEAFLDRFAALPVQYNGRLQPVDTLARNALLILGGKQSVALTKVEAIAFGKKPSMWSAEEKSQIESAGLKFSAFELGLLEVRPVPMQRNLVGKYSVKPVAFLAELAFRPQIAAYFHVFRVENAEVRALFPPKQGAVVYYSWNEVFPVIGEVEKNLKAMQSRSRTEAKTSFDRGLSKFVDAANTYHMLSQTFAPNDIASGHFPEEEYAAWQQALVSAAKALSQESITTAPSAQQLDPLLARAVTSAIARYRELSKDGRVGIVPPRSDREQKEGRWGNLGESLLGVSQGLSLEAMPVLPLYGVLYAGYQLGDAEAESLALKNLEGIFAEVKDLPARKIEAERIFNFIEPFFLILCGYMLLFLLTCFGWLLSKSWVRGLARWFALFLFLSHTGALLWRMWLQGRPPVTNIYSTAVFVAWGAVLLGFIAERFLRNGIGNAAAGIIGFVSLIIAHHLSMGGDTLKMMEAVLDSNFWLAVHVVTITLGYSAMFVAGLLAALWLILRALGWLVKGQTAMLERVVFGVVCFALLLSFLGTMFGGIWADQSWGRFWGWDPKENGALMIVFWCALFIHARLGKLLHFTGMMQLAVAGNIVTSASWFGTNLLGIGLHSYGFSNGGFLWLLAFWISQFVLISLGWLRRRPLTESAQQIASPEARPEDSGAR
ncbi:MAG: cytochrome c biogenesis protein ResB [Puniceicoccales bacterium]|jgi:ABC-type transport system involved in cytochrome c biogenesis permease subunit|nr:cytochrome c biogenesis protein ResB [Puniceicoccales bacterium]